MATITTQKPILDSAGQPVNGFITWTQSADYDSPEGLITTATGKARVISGRLYDWSGAPLVIPQTPPGQHIRLMRTFGADVLPVRHVTVPADVEIEYSLLPDITPVAPPSPGGGVTVTRDPNFPGALLIGA